MTEARPPKRRVLTISVPAAGLIAGNLGRSASYGAAHNDDLPVIRFGRLFRVLVAKLETLLGVEPLTIERMLADDPALAAMAGVVIDIADSDAPPRSRATITRKAAGEDHPRHQRRARGEGDAARASP
jgi:hypothetical protein